MVEVLVEYAYDAQLIDELTICIGDRISNVKQLEGGWWEGSLNGKTGMFPDNFVKVISQNGSSPVRALHSTLSSGDRVPSPAASNRLSLESSTDQQLCNGESVPPQKQFRVIFSYTPVHNDELELKVGAVLEYIMDVEDGWWKGRLDGKVGVFPSNFVEIIPSKSSNGVRGIRDLKERFVNDKNKKNEEIGKGGNIGNNITRSNSNRGKKLSTDSLIAQTRNSESLSLSSLSNSSPAIKQFSSSKISKTIAELHLANVPKLPPKPVKEQCIVVYPYTAVNDDELSLEENQIVNIVSKEVEDKGWWKGEIDGKVGVFPDNFVKMVPHNHLPSSNVALSSSNNQNISNDTNRGNKKITTTTTSKPEGDIDHRVFKSSLPDEGKTQSGGGEGIRLRNRTSFGKANPPPKPKTTPFFENDNSGSKNTTGSNLSEVTLDLDAISISSQRLSHLNASRAKAPPGRKRPSSNFIKEMPNSSNSIGVLEKSVSSSPEVVEVTKEETNKDHKGRSFKLTRKIKDIISSSSNSSGDVQTSETTTKTSTSRLSFRGVSSSSQVSATTDRKSVPTTESIKFGPPGLLSSAVSTSALDVNRARGSSDGSTRPNWLEELSRKQANRKSGIFIAEDVAPPESCSTVKPTIPLKPSQIKADEARKVANGTSTTSLPRRRTSSVVLSLQSASKIGLPSPTFINNHLDKSDERSTTESDENNLSISKAGEISFDSSPSVLQEDDLKEKPSNLDVSSQFPVEADETTLADNHTLTKRVEKLEQLLMETRKEFTAQILSLTRSLEEERQQNNEIRLELQRLSTS